MIIRILHYLIYKLLIKLRNNVTINYFLKKSNKDNKGRFTLANQTSFEYSIEYSVQKLERSSIVCTCNFSLMRKFSTE